MNTKNCHSTLQFPSALQIVLMPFSYLFCFLLYNLHSLVRSDWSHAPLCISGGVTTTFIGMSNELINFKSLITNQFAVSFPWIWHPASLFSISICRLTKTWLVNVMDSIWIVILHFLQICSHFSLCSSLFYVPLLEGSHLSCVSLSWLYLCLIAVSVSLSIYLCFNSIFVRKWDVDAQ